MNLVGRQVIWNKISGKLDATMEETSGFGSLVFLGLECRMIITGDYGLNSSPVQKIEEFGNEVTVHTLNSVYLIKTVNG